MRKNFWSEAVLMVVVCAVLVPAAAAQKKSV